MAEDEDVFVGDDLQREPVGAGLADLVQLENEGRGTSRSSRSPTRRAALRSYSSRPVASATWVSWPGRSTS